MSINPPDAPGFTQMYSFGVRSDVISLQTLVGGGWHEHLVITVRAVSREAAIRHVKAIFEGKYKTARLTFWDDLDEWKRQADGVQ